MKRLLLTLLLAGLPYGLSAQDWSQNPTKPSILLLAEGQASFVNITRPAIYKTDEQGLAGRFSALFELPASNNSNILLKAAIGRRAEDTAPLLSWGRARVTDWNFTFGFGVRFLLGK